jgi:hypothetical protein
VPPPISPVFNYYNRSPNQFYEEELRDLLCPQPYAGEKALATQLTFGTVVDAQALSSSYHAELMKTDAGITLKATNIYGGVPHHTEMNAVKLTNGLYEIRNLEFDNHPERLDSRWEITKVLAHIGREQLQKACRGEQPVPHEERGEFGKFRRFLRRWMPDNPHPFMTPPC